MVLLCGCCGALALERLPVGRRLVHEPERVQLASQPQGSGQLLAGERWRQVGHLIVRGFQVLAVKSRALLDVVALHEGLQQQARLGVLEPKPQVLEWS